MRFKRAVLSVVVLSLGLGLTACESMDDFFSTKKPLPGERKALFPQGVPGVPQGVPPDLVKGYQPPPEQAEPVVAEQPVAKPKPAAKPKPRPRQVAAPRPQPAPAAPQAAADPAFPAPQVPAQSAAPSNSPWPDPPKPGTFSR